MKSVINVGVVIINYHQERDTIECLESLSACKKQTSFKLSTIVVNVEDSANTEMLKKYADYVLETSNEGFSGNNNFGMKYAINTLHCTHVLLLNNDTIVDKNLISSLVDFEQKHVGQANVYTPKIFFEKGYEFHKKEYEPKELGHVLWYAGGFIDWKNMYGWHIGVDEVDHGQFDDENETAFATGCCMLIPASTINKVGYLDNRYFLYWEDTDYCMRVKLHGGHIWYVGSAHMWHKNAGSSGGSGSDTHMYYQTRNRLFFGMRYAQKRTKLALIREATRMLLHGSKTQKEAILDVLLMHMGKRRRT